MSDEMIKDAQLSSETYHSENFKLNKKKLLRPSYGTYFMLIVYCSYILVPLYIIVITSMKTLAEANMTHFTWWPILGFSFDGYKSVFAGNSIVSSLTNTFLYYGPSSIIHVFMSAVSAYGFAKLEFTGRSQIFGFLIITMTLPGSVTQSSSRVWMATLGLEGTEWPLILPGLCGSIGQVFFLKQYIAGIPDDLIGAAKIDGMGQLKIFLSLIIPLTLPALLVRVILGFIGSYNDYMGPLIYTMGYKEKWTLQLALKNFSDINKNHPEYRMAAAVIGMFPLIIIYIFIQDYIIRSTQIGSGLKG